MSKRVIKALCLVLAFSSVFFALFSCGAKISDAEIAEIAKPLIEKSGRINEIFFGGGLPMDEERSDMYIKDMAEDTDIKNTYYLPVAQDCGFESTEEIKEAAKEVYTYEYCENNLFSVAFSGIKSSNGEVLEYARFIDNEYSELSQRYDIADGSALSVREFDFDTVKSIKQGSGYIIFSVETYINGEKSDTLRLTLKNEASGWRLDTPTY